MNELTLDGIRKAGLTLVMSVAGTLSVALLAGMLATGAEGFVTVLLALVALLAYPTWLWRTGATDSTARIAASMALVAIPAIMLFAFRGMAWQVDLHMAFFAALAITAVLCDWRAIIGATLVVAVHHLVLGMAVPDWVFLGGSSFARILLHAVILLGEAGALVFISARVVALLDAIAQKDAVQRATEAAITAEREQRMRELESASTALAHGLEGLSRGELHHRITGSMPSGYATIQAYFNEAIESLRTLVEAVSGGAAQLDQNSSQIAHAAEDLAARSERTSARIDDASSAIGQIDARLSKGNSTVRETVARADEAIDSVRRGRGVTDDAVHTMECVATSAKGIDDVIEGLDKIAFQTRVLAMNAAVEAGRAGEAGRGFAVVADLVGQLAMRSEEEAKRAREQLTATQDQVASAVTAIGQVDGALNGIEQVVERVHLLLTGMAEDYGSHTSALSEVSSAFTTLNEFTQQNAAMVEESNAAARALSDEARALARLTERFTLEEQGAPMPLRQAA